MEWIKDFAGALASVSIFVLTLALGWVKAISNRIDRAHTKIGLTNSAIAQTDVRLAVLEHSVTQVPQLLQEIKGELQGMRREGQEREKTLYDHMDKVRLELKKDIATKVDK